MTLLTAAFLLAAFAAGGPDPSSSSPSHLPKIAGREVRLLDSAADVSAAIAYRAPEGGPFSRVRARWSMSLNEGGEGVAFALLPVAAYGESGPVQTQPLWEEPNLPGAFAVAFDIHNPKTDQMFGPDGNIDGQPEREVSLHWNGVEVANRLSPVEFRGKGYVPVDVELREVVGGSEVTVRVAGAAVYDRFFVPELLPYRCRAAFGGRTTKSVATCDLKDVKVTYSRPAKQAPKPLHVQAFDAVLNDGAHHAHEATVQFPENTDAYGRIICTLTLAEPKDGFDRWDRMAAVYLFDERGERFEVLRYITPYRRGYTWKVDVTDFRSLLRGRRAMRHWCETYGTGWLVSVGFDFYPGKSDAIAYKVQNLWSGQPEIGNPDLPVSSFYVPMDVQVPKDAWKTKVRTVVTGHGGDPNTDNAAEFMPIKRTLRINGTPFENLLWKTDVYLNPLRPQSGTWKFCRAGWAPGDVVAPWVVDASKLVKRGGTARIEYELAPYLNKERGDHMKPTHWTESQVIFYRKP